VKVATVLTLVLLLAAPAGAAIIADHTGVAEFDQIPEEQFDEIRASYGVYYGHTSHGSQIMTGLNMLEDEDPVRYERPFIRELGYDLGHHGDTVWVQQTHSALELYTDINVVMWSWCSGCSDNTEEGISIYLAAMEGLEAEYPQVTFIYMTGHLDGTGPDGNLYRSNNQIRDYCLTHDKVLYDFADIESWDPDGNYYPYETDACNWCSDWCASNGCPGCGDCSHSHCFNCYLKGKGFWWMMARVQGWESPTPVNEVQQAPTVQLQQNHPNPFNPETEIRFQIEKEGWVSLEIFRVTGQRIIALHDGTLEAGEHSFRWNGRDGNGHDLGSGVYLYRLRTRGQEVTRKLTLFK